MSVDEAGYLYPNLLNHCDASMALFFISSIFSLQTSILASSFCLLHGNYPPCSTFYVIASLQL